MDENTIFGLLRSIPEDLVNIFEWFYNSGYTDATDPTGSFHKALGEWVDGRPRNERE